MAILNNNPLVGASGNQGGYNINNSLRFRSSASAYFNRTPASAGNRQKFTYSVWHKSSLVNVTSLLNANSNSSNTDAIYFDSNKLVFESNVSGVNIMNLTTSQVFRDPSAWYHFVFSVDTTQATAANRIKIYVNGQQITVFTTATYPSQNSNLNINSNVAHNIGRFLSNGGSTYYSDGYYAETHFIDGQAKAASDFGETDTTTGVWKPKAYTGTYGTNGFYLKFSDIATTSGSNAGLGKDFSGNSNYWTTNNISVTSGSTYDAMTDSPTNTSATVANYAVLNPLNKNSSGTLSNANLTWQASGGSPQTVLATTSIPSSNKIYFELNVATAAGGGTYVQLGIAPEGKSLSSDIGTASGNGYSIEQNGATDIYLRLNGTPVVVSTVVQTGDVFQVAVDKTSGKIWFGRNNTWYNSSGGTTGNPSSGTNETATISTTTEWFPGVTKYSTGGDYQINFGQRPFSYTPPTGFVALNTYNLPTPTILQGNKYMDATLYTGNGSTQSITNAGAFRPDFVWIKRRDGAGQDHVLQDSNRGFGGTTKLASSSTAAENTTGGATGSEWGSVTAANSNGFSITASTSGDQVNKNTWTYVGWQWQAGQGSTSSNTSGSITSTVSVSTTAGFSIVNYTGNGTAGATVGHGLGVTPAMVIVKRRSAVNGWAVYHSALGGTKYIALNTTDSANTASTLWNNTNTSSTLVTLGTDTWVNASSATYVAYCWAEIAGFSKFGSYTGNGSTDGPFVFTGFRPKYLMVKRYDTTGEWLINDSSRDLYNPEILYLQPHLTSAEGTLNPSLDFLSNGFKFRTINGNYNASAGTYIYMAFAENPFKNSLAR